jgi:RND superfamily putative drug exporter
VTRHPVLTALPVVLCLVALGTPFLHVRWGIPDDRVLPASAAARQVGDALRSDFTVDADNTLDIVTESALPCRPPPATAGSYRCCPA